MNNVFNDILCANHSELVLARIAETLDCPVAMFSQKFYSKPEQTSELIRLWSTIENEQDCLKILAFVRTFAGRAVAKENRVA